MALVRCMCCAENWSTSSLKFTRDGKTQESWPICAECAVWLMKQQTGIEREHRTVTLHPMSGAAGGG